MYEAVFTVVVGIVCLTTAAMQYLYTIGRLDLSQWPWPFVHQGGRAWKLTFAAGLALMGLGGLVAGMVGLAK